jgi:hypothetical protein
MRNADVRSDLQCICITVDRDAITDTDDPEGGLSDDRLTDQDRFERALSDLQADLSLVRYHCSGEWKETWGTDETKIVLSGSSMSVPRK